MRVQITFKTSGGIAYFPGLAAGKTVDVDALPQDRGGDRRPSSSRRRSSTCRQRTAAETRRGGIIQTYTISGLDRRSSEDGSPSSDPVPPELARLWNCFGS
jgi:hypothetical protein